jgi:hypothetical protein
MPPTFGLLSAAVLVLAARRPNIVDAVEELTPAVTRYHRAATVYAV